MKIVVYGLGIIGGSLAAALKRAGHTVYGKNRGADALSYALSHAMIDGAVSSYEGADVVFLALPPKVAMKELEEGDFPAGVVVSDICGVKRPLERVVFSKPRAYRYVGAHPMAGKETSGIASASAALFDGANIVLTRSAHTDGDALALVRSLAKEMGFGRVVECDAATHDEMIALTSQLAHIVSGAYIKSPLSAACEGFTGGSFQDMTRVAGVDEKVWTELYFLNRDNLLSEIGRLKRCLGEFEDALAQEDGERMRALLREGRSYRERFFSQK